MAGGEVVVYKRRWLILTIFVAYSMSNSFQWIHLNIIGDLVLTYFNESLPTDPGKAQVFLYRSFL